MANKKKHTISLIIGLIISAGFLYFSLRSIRFSDLIASFKSVNYLWMIPFCVVTMVSFWFRAYRWKFLLPGANLPASRLFPPVMIGFAFNAIFPARAGEFARAFALKSRDGVPFGKGFGSVVMERLFDGITMLVLLLIGLRTLTIDPALSISYLDFTITGEQFNNLASKAFWPFLIIFIGVCFILFSKTRQMMEWVILRLPLLPQKIKDGIAGLLRNFAEGLGSIKDPKRIAIVIALSVVIWLMIAWTHQLMAYGFTGFTRTMTFHDAMMIMIIIAVAIMVPGAPGYWGQYELGGMFAMVILVLVENTESGRALALSYIILVHALQMMLTIVFGMWYAARAHVSYGKVEEAEEKIEDTVTTS